MSEPYAGDGSVWIEDVRLVEDGEAASQAFLALGDQDLADRTAYLHDRMPTTILRGRKTIVSGAGLSIVKGTTETANAVFSSTDITTLVGDEIEILFVGDVAFQYATYGGNHNGLVVQISIEENGTGYTVLKNSTFQIEDRDLATGFGTFTKGTLSILGFRTVATAGTFHAKVEIAFTGSGQAGDAGDLLAYRSVINQYRTP